MSVLKSRIRETGDEFPDNHPRLRVSHKTMPSQPSQMDDHQISSLSGDRTPVLHVSLTDA